MCVGGAERPCYKMAYFHDVSSRVAFSEARQACEMDGGALLSIESSTEQRDIEHLLQVRPTPGSLWPLPSFFCDPSSLFFFSRSCVQVRWVGQEGAGA